METITKKITEKVQEQNEVGNLQVNPNKTRLGEALYRDLLKIKKTFIFSNKIV